jgi:D-amino-acid dehydrogenase
MNTSPPPSSRTHVVIIGAGLIGLTTALELTERGASVTIVDVTEPGSGASQGNAGFFCPGQLAPLAAPGQITTALRSLINPDSALRIHPKALPSMIGWGWRFMRASTADRFRAGQAALVKLNSSMERLLIRLEALGVNVESRPEIVVPFHDEAHCERFFADCARVAQYGVPAPAAILDGATLRKKVPALTDHVRSGFVFPVDRAADPRSYVHTLLTALATRDIEIVRNRKITGFDHAGSGALRAVETNYGNITGDQFVLAAGAGIRGLGTMLRLNIPVIPGQGYNVSFPTTDRLPHAVIVEEVHAVATPLNDRIRLGGTMEFAGDRPPFDQRRVDAILRSMRPFFDWDWSKHRETWSGSRPMSADGLPIIGRPSRYRNVVIAGGHGMYGYTLAPVTGEAVAELIVDGTSQTDLTAFDPNRF